MIIIIIIIIIISSSSSRSSSSSSSSSSMIIITIISSGIVTVVVFFVVIDVFDVLMRRLRKTRLECTRPPGALSSGKALEPSANRLVAVDSGLLSTVLGSIEATPSDSITCDVCMYVYIYIYIERERSVS